MNEKGLKSLYKRLPENRIGDFMIKHKKATKADVRSMKMGGIFGGSYREYYDFTTGNYVCLQTTSETIMSNTPMEIRTNREVVERANGRVLIVGLGIGVVPLQIHRKKEVSEIVIVEKQQEVIDLVWENIRPQKCRLIKADIYDWLPMLNEKFDVIYFDIWNGICSDNWQDMKLLHKKFRKYLNKKNENNFLSSWRKDDCQRLCYGTY